MTSTKSIPLVLGSLLGIMLAILCLVLYLFYKKRKESLEFKIPLEKMTRGLKSMSLKRSPKSSNGSRSSNDSLSKQQQRVCFFPCLFSSVFSWQFVLQCFFMRYCFSFRLLFFYYCFYNTKLSYGLLF